MSRGGGAYVLFNTRAVENIVLEERRDGAGFLVLGDGDPNTIDSLGMAVAGAGDVNGDGLDDVLINSWSVGASGQLSSPVGVTQGIAYVAFGKLSSDDVPVYDLLAGRGPGFAIGGPSDASGVGFTIAGAGDVNGDARADIALTVPAWQGGASAVFVVFGKDDTDVVGLVDVARGVGGFAIIEEADNELWTQTGSVGDLNGDGLADIGVGGPYHPDPGRLAVASFGRVRVVFGRRDPSPTLSLADLDSDPSLGYTLSGVAEGDGAFLMDAAGDVNGDGLDDMIITAQLAARDEAGAPLPESDAGAPPIAPQRRGMTYVVLGSSTPAAPSLDEIERRATSGFAIRSVTQEGMSASISSGDLDADGFADLAFGVGPNAVRRESEVVFGTPEATSLGLEAAAERVLLIEGDTDRDTNRVVASGADFNGDGLDDLLVGASLYPNPLQLGGGAYLAFGYDARGTLNGRGPALIGGARNDTFELPIIPPLLVRGGHGRDTLRAGSLTPTVDLRPRGRWESIEVIDVRGGGPHQVLLGEVALRRIPENQPGFAFALARTLSVLGDAEDSVALEAAGFGSRGVRDGRAVYGKDGVYYGLEGSEEMTLTPLASAQ